MLGEGLEMNRLASELSTTVICVRNTLSLERSAFLTFTSTKIFVPTAMASRGSPSEATRWNTASANPNPTPTSPPLLRLRLKLEGGQAVSSQFVFKYSQLQL
jgi:hypothetical protein